MPTLVASQHSRDDTRSKLHSHGEKLAVLELIYFRSLHSYATEIIFLKNTRQCRFLTAFRVFSTYTEHNDKQLRKYERQTERERERARAREEEKRGREGGRERERESQNAPVIPEATPSTGNRFSWTSARVAYAIRQSYPFLCPMYNTLSFLDNEFDLHRFLGIASTLIYNY